jgi:hypothetical protein
MLNILLCQKDGFYPIDDVLEQLDRFGEHYSNYIRSQHIPVAVNADEYEKEKKLIVLAENGNEKKEISELHEYRVDKALDELMFHAIYTVQERQEIVFDSWLEKNGLPSRTKALGLVPLPKPRSQKKEPPTIYELEKLLLSDESGELLPAETTDEAPPSATPPKPRSKKKEPQAADDTTTAKKPQASKPKTRKGE